MTALYCYLGVAGLCLTLWLSARKYVRLQSYRQYFFTIFAAAVFGGAVFCLEQAGGGKWQEERYIKRTNPGEGSGQAELWVEADGLSERQPMEVTIYEIKMSEDELRAALEQAEQELDRIVGAKCSSNGGISEDLNLPMKLQENLVDVSYIFDNYDVLDGEGKILWENFTEEEYLVKVTSELKCQEETAIYEFYVKLTTKDLDIHDRMLLKIKGIIQQQNEKDGSDKIELPSSADGKELIWYTAKEEIHWKLFMLGIILPVLLFLRERREKELKVQRWEHGLILDYPDIVSQLSLLTGAGMTVTTAFTRIAQGYRAQKEFGGRTTRPGYEEMQKTIYEIRDGVGEARAYERFGVRCCQQTYRKLSSILVQNVKKGAKGMQQLLDDEAKEAYVQRKLLAKQLGEEAGTKLLVPMGFMLVLVFIILLVPAGLSLQL